MRLRALELKDAPFMLEWLHDGAINRFFRFDGAAATLESAEEYIRAARSSDNCLHLACADDGDEYLGTVSLKNIDAGNRHAEFATSFRACAQGSGAAAFAARELLRRAFGEMGLERVYLNVLSDNARALSFYEKLGFVREGVLRSHVYIKGEPKDLALYGILSGEYHDEQR